MQQRRWCIRWFPTSEKLLLQALQPAPLPTATEDAVVAYADKTPGKDVLGEAAHELGGAQAHLPLLSTLSVILVGKADPVFTHIQDAVIADSHLVRVAAQVLNNLTRTTEGPLGVDHRATVAQSFLNKLSNKGLSATP